MRRSAVRSAGRRSDVPRRVSTLSVVLVCCACSSLALSFCRHFMPQSQKAARATGHSPRRAAEVEKGSEKAPATGAAKDEAAATRGLFMSLDSEEFGMDSDDMAAAAEKTAPKEETVTDKLGESASGLGAVAVLTVVLIALTYYFFFTKQAEEAFYYSSMRDRSSGFGPEEIGADFRSYNQGEMATAP